MLIKLLLIILPVTLTAWIFFKLKRKSQEKHLLLSQMPVISTPEVEAFSGDNQNDTQLDLAAAYIELHQLEKAKLLLKSVITHGDSQQVTAARHMFAELLKQEKKRCPD